MLTSEHILAPITTTQIEQASARIRGSVLRTPIVRLNIDSDMEIYLKLENLQPTGSFKVRGACNSIALAGPAAKSRGVYTCSAGNMAQALAWQARQNGIPCSAIVPDNAPETKLQAEPRSSRSPSTRSGRWPPPTDMAHWKVRFSFTLSVTKR
ncbi:pyridoxal-phosphate dependent enzyme [Candidatus Bathyarchaeota archaeon]|nr:MAG: pyridoxal-phosphate dependent enzyme [Candidatus Bathyarchaeota archaeon]